jgi:hypothetical protein
MTARPARLTTLARAVLAIALLLICSGVLWYGVSAETHSRMWRDIFDRPGGPMTFRFILQPVMAAIAAFADGVRDARTGRSSYILTIITRPEKSAARLAEGLNATARVLLLGIGMDAIYQFRVFGTFYPGEALVISFALAFIPYVLMRDVATHLARWRMRGHRADPAGRAEG